MERLLEICRSGAGFLGFARMEQEAQLSILRSDGILVDIDFCRDRFIHLYFLNGFFVEVTVSPEGNATEVIPFRQGYRMKSYFKKESVLIPKRQISGRKSGFLTCPN
jgi:hypothetical protein